MTKLDVDNNRISGKVLADLLVVLPVRKLNLVRNKLTDEMVQPIQQNLASTRNLKILFMSHNQLSDRAVGMLAEGLRVNAGIEEVQFTHNDLSLPNGQSLIGAFAHMPNLHKLSLNSCNLIVPCLEALRDALAENTVLQDISLYSNEIDAEGAAIISTMLANKKSLKTLGLSNNIIGQGGARELAANCLRELTSLSRLALESNLIGNVGLEAVAQALLHNTSLTEIFLYNNDLDDDTMAQFAEMLTNKASLQTLGLEYNRIRSRGFNHVFNALKLLPRFERLFCSHNLLSEESATELEQLLSISTSLKEIRLNNNTQIGDTAGLSIAKGLLRSKSIRVCHISDTKISGQSALKLCEVIRRAGSTLKDLDISNNLIIMDDIEMLANAFKESRIECLNIRNNIVSAEEIVAFEHLLVPVSTMTKRKFIF